MKKITPLIFLCLLAYFSSFGQNNTFFNAYTSGHQIYWYFAEQADSDYIFTGTYNGNTVWAHADSAGNFKTCTTFNSPLSFVTPLSGNSILIAGTKGNDSLTLLKIDAKGNSVWANTYTIPALTNVGPSRAIVLKHSNNICISGIGQKGSTAIGFVLETDSTGNLINSVYFTADTTSGKEIANMGGFAAAGDNTCYLSMRLGIPLGEDPNGWTDFIKMDSLLNIKWVRASSPGNFGSMLIRGNKIITTTGWVVYSALYNTSYGATYISRLDTSVNLDTTIDLGETRPGSSGILATKDGGEVIYGARGQGFLNGTAAKIDSSLNIQWARTYSQYGANDFEQINSVMPTKDGGYIMAGTSTSNTNYTILAGYIAKTNAKGDDGCDNTPFTYSISSLNKTKYMLDTLLYGPLTVSTSAAKVTTALLEDTLISYCYNGVLGINTVSGPTAKVSIYPNPSNGTFLVAISNYELGIKNTIEIYNMLGEQLYTGNLNSATTQIDLASQVSGLYLYRVMTENGDLISAGKFAIQK